MARNANEQPLVSVCCTTYNHAPYIGQAIESFLAQEVDFPIEILVRDDCSTDGTSDIILDLAARYPHRIRAFIEPENTFSKGRKPFPELFPLARGKYLALCEGDDLWRDRRKLARQVAVFERDPRVTFCFHSALMVDVLDGKEQLLNNHFPQDSYVNLEALILDAAYVPTASMMFRNEHVEELIASYRKAPVGDYFIQMYMAALGKAYYINRPMALYRRHTRTSWTSGFRSIDEQVSHRRRMLPAIDAFYPYIRHRPEARLLADVYIRYATLALLPLKARSKILAGQIALLREARHLPRWRLLWAMVRDDARRVRDWLGRSWGQGRMSP